MEYHEIGKTGMKVSSLSFGASSLGGVFHDIKEKEGLEAVFTAIDLGMNFIDVSPYYGHYKAETVLGKALNSSRQVLSLYEGRTLWKRRGKYLGLFRKAGHGERVRKYESLACGLYRPD